MKALVEAIVRKDTPSTKGIPDSNAVKVLLNAIKDRFIDERISGFINPRTKQSMPPISAKEAKALWARKEPEFVHLLLKTFTENDPADEQMLKHFGGDRSRKLPQSSHYYNDTPAPTEKQLESRVSGLVQRMVT